MLTWMLNILFKILLYLLKALVDLDPKLINFMYCQTYCLYSLTTMTNLTHRSFIIIIIIHRLQSRRPQGFSMHDDHQQMQQSAVLALLLHYPQAIFVHN